MSSEFGSKNSLLYYIFTNELLTSSQLHTKENSSSVPASSLQEKNVCRHVVQLVSSFYFLGRQIKNYKAQNVIGVNNVLIST